MKPAYLLYYLFIVNVIDFSLFAIDKQRAKHHKWRIRERTLFLFAWLGGGLGGYLAMQLLRHKTQHTSFKIIIPLTILLWCAGIIILRKIIGFSFF